MGDSHTAAKALLLASVRDPAVAAAAGIGASQWSGRVLAGDKSGYVAELHRGRLPAVEVYQISDQWTMLSADDGGQGVIEAQWGLRIHSGKFDQDEAEDQCRYILYVALSKIRANAYFTIGDDVSRTFGSTPLGHALEAVLTVQTAMGRDTYEVTNPGSQPELPDGGTVGGIDIDVAWDAASPVTVLNLPSGQALDKVQAKVKTAFDGAGAQVTIGIDGDQERYLAGNESDLSLADTVWERDASDAGPRTVKVWITPGSGATQGVVNIQISVTEAA